MRRSTLLISRHLFNKVPELAQWNIRDFRNFLKLLLSDPLLKKKMQLLESGKYTKTYQQDGLDLIPVKFYPFPEDWCELSALSNGSGFSRCYIFVFLLEFHFGLRDFSDAVTNPKKSVIPATSNVHCLIKVSRGKRILERNLWLREKNPRPEPLISIIPLSPKQILLDPA